MCDLLTTAGATVIRLPALHITAVSDAVPAADSASGLFDIIIFTSANAVHFGAALLAGQATAAVAAIGPATARALGLKGFQVTLMPSGGFDSEHLLEHPRLKEPSGQRILIVKGRQGRELLRERLRERGAVVVLAEVYERVRADYGAEQLEPLAATFAAGGVDVITATSADVVGALLELATAPLRRSFEQVHWLVPGARVAQAVRAHGITAPLIQADSAEDHDLLAAILRWRAGVSDA